MMQSETFAHMLGAITIKKDGAAFYRSIFFIIPILIAKTGHLATKLNCSFLQILVVFDVCQNLPVYSVLFCVSDARNASIAGEKYGLKQSTDKGLDEEKLTEERKGEVEADQLEPIGKKGQQRKPSVKRIVEERGQ